MQIVKDLHNNCKRFLKWEAHGYERLNIKWKYSGLSVPGNYQSFLHVSTCTLWITLENWDHDCLFLQPYQILPFAYQWVTVTTGAININSFNYFHTDYSYVFIVMFSQRLQNTKYYHSVISLNPSLLIWLWSAFISLFALQSNFVQTIYNYWNLFNSSSFWVLTANSDS